ncbi:autotransporter domain-containing protein [Cupriavidus basilensis]|uniref:Autotransporter domain-containing protein n=1 Tax=Cupriavidus basilensis TaxID=68895 RepID=A0ABT6B1P0_9BURK|nr:autotransporter outer membrane beta-barrel domain-containing protein [Cupriavidus basilensis]MDF3837836.1 autotransporter domain-containing protein [Cupriavidus basilensis]
MIAQSIGGGGGVGGNAFAQVGMIQVIPPPEGFLPVTLGGSVAVGGRGGFGGIGGAVSVESDGPLLTTGISSIGILAQSIGGGGGAGGNAQGMTTSTGNGTLSLNIGGHGGSGNHGGTVSVTNTDDIKTLGEHSYAIHAQSIGGGGGNGGSASRLTGNLFSAGLGDTNALISLVRTLRTLNAGDWTPGKFTPSFQATATIGGSGGAAGDGNAVTVTNGDSATIETTGASAHAIVAQSIGGGGGNGGNVSSSSNANLATTIMGALQTAAGAGANWRQFPETFGGNFAVGGQGGSSGKGGLVTVLSKGAISTNGQNAAGVFAQSIGGGGGNGGSVGRSVEEIVKDLFSDPKVGGTILSIIEGAVPLLRLQGGGSLSFNIGGQGGSSGEAGGVSVTNDGSITTTGAHSPGVFAQAVGGGGGNAGSSNQLFGGQTFNFDINIGRGGGGGGNGGSGVRRPNDSTDYAVVIDHQGSIITGGVDSAGVFAQSIGGGGGKSAAHFGGGFSGSFEPYPLSGQTKLGADGASGHGGNVSATSAGTIKTSGALSHAIMAQSVGGGGGAASLLFTELTSPNQINVSNDIRLGATATSSPSDGGGVTVDVNNAIQTSGTLAFGVLAQSVGAGGGYVASASDTGPLSSPVKLTLNAAGTSTGHGAAVGVKLDSNGGIATSGQNAFGIFAQSVGAGGGVAGLTTTAGLITLADTSSRGYNGYGDGGKVTIAVDGRVRTTGDGAAGVVAQSIGGGGGIAGNMAAVSYDLNLIKDAGITGGAGQGGHVIVNVLGGDTYQADKPGIVTRGANAPAILAMSLGSGAILTDAGLLLKRPGETPGNSGGAIDITVGKNALVSAQGKNSPAIYAVSVGNSGAGAAGIHRGGDISLTIGQSAQVTGGNGSLGAAIATNTTGMTTIVNNGGRISSLGGNAITTSGSAILTNTSGRIAGNIVLGGNASAISNADELHPGAIVTIGGNGLLTNTNVLGLGMQTRYTTTLMTGRFHQTSDGMLLVNLDYANNKSDRLSVSGESNFGGMVLPDVANPLKGKNLTIAHFDTALGPMAFTAGASDDGATIISHALQLSADRKDVTITPRANFTKASAALKSDQSRIASHLQALWDSGYEGAASIFTPFTKLPSLTAYRNALGNLASDVAHSRVVSQVHQSYSFFNGLMSCPTFIDGGTRLREGECSWGRITGNLVNRSASGDDSGYRTKQATYQFGLQKEIARDWFLGGSLSYSSATTTADQNAVDVSSNTISAGLAIKRQIGPWLFAAAVRGGYEASEMTRAVSLPSFNARAKSSPDAYHLGGRLRASYEIGFRNWYLRPYTDIDINYAYQPGYRETGAGVFDLAAQRASRVSVMTTPSLEIGGRVDLGNMTIRPYATAGVSFLSNGGWTAQMQFASLAGSGVAPFQIETGAPRTYGNLTVGLDLVTKKGFELKAEYGLRAANNYVDQSARLRAALRF